MPSYLTKSEIETLLEYRDGELYWLESRGPIACGTRAGYIGKDQRKRITLKKKSYLAHRIIFLLHHGYLPDYLDHIDNDKTNNRIENLRPATVIQNQRNAKIRADNTSGIKNVCWNKLYGKWYVVIRVDKKRHYLGYFDDLELAALVASEAREKYHGEFARHK